MGEDRFGNFSSCCRICLSDKFNDLKPIFEDEAESRTLVQRILHFLGVEVSPNDKISTMICSQCRSKVNNWDSFKRVCIKNQSKLNDWLNSWNAASQGSNNIGHAVIQVKDEPIDADEVQMLEDSTEEQGITIKDEQNEEFYELPPQLTPNSRNEIDDLQTVSLVNGYGVSSVVKNSKQCTFCYKLFSTSGNRMKHERLLHNNRKSSTPAFFGNANSNVDDNSQQSMESHLSSSILTETSNIDSETDNPENIQFASGLRLTQKSTDSTTSSLDSQLTSIELAYIERNKTLVSMLHKFKCACHNVSFQTVKRLYAHLRMSYTWFPVFTCYNCVITFSTRSLNMKHTSKCPKPYLENTLRMSEVKRRSESKIRLYQYSKCNKCENLYAYYEDFCDHIDKEHSIEPPFVCLCSKEFDTAGEFQQHAYTNCFLNFYCDVCFSVFETVKDFRTHCEEEHDQIEGYHFVTPNDTFEYVTRTEVVALRKRKHDEMVKENAAVNGEEFQDQEDEEGNPRKKFVPVKLYTEPTTCELCERRFANYHSLRKHMRAHRRSSIANRWKSDPSTCDKCGKVFSTYYNMIRHYKVHDDAEKHLQCALCTERFRLVSELKDHLILVHGRANICQECGRQFESVKELEQHRAVHLNIKVYRDSKTQSYRTSAKPKHICELCENVFDTEDDLNEHVALHDNISHMSVESVEKPETKETENQKDLGQFSCSDCDRHYVSYKGLWIHNRRHHPERKRAPQTFPCQYCDRVLQTNAAYQMHKQMHERMLERMQRQAALPPAPPKTKEEEDESYFTCKHCFKVFSTKYNLKTHLKSHGIFVAPGRTYSKSGKFVKTFWCDICHQACQGYAELQKHKQEHIREKLKESQTMQMAEAEEEEDIKPQIFPCDICNKGFLSKSQLIQHKALHEQEIKGTQKKNFVYCKYCKIPYLNVESLNRHMEQEHNELKIQKPKITGKKHQCNLCKKSFNTAGALCSHQGWHKRGKSEKQLKSDRLTKVNVKRECTSCNLTFLTDAALQAHALEAHRSVNAQVLPSRCSICNIEFKTQASYDEHVLLHRTTSTAFQCKYCTRKFNKSETFNIHVNETHPEHAEHKFKCHQCERIFEKQNALTIHLKVHDRQRLTGAPITSTAPKPHVYKCSICHLGFEIPKDLRNHIITSHPF